MNIPIKENRLRGTLAFPIVLYEVAHRTRPFATEFHWQEDVEVLSIKHGDFKLLLDGKLLTLHPGDIIFINPGQLHFFRALNQDAECDIFIFPLQHLLFECEDHDQQKFVRPLSEGTIGFPTYLPEDAELQQLIRNIIHLQKQKPPVYELMTKALLLQLIGTFAQQNAFVPLYPTKQTDVCKQILTYIHQHYMQKITTAEISAAVGISPTYFSTFFANNFLQNFSEYLNQYRIEQACNLLANSTLTITDIALETGFCSSSHFIQHFREAKGITPYAYRKQISTKE